MMMEAKIDQDIIPQLARQQTAEGPLNVNIDFLPSAAPDLSWEGGELSIRYEMDKLNFNWRMNQMNFTFVPGDIEFTMTQRQMSSSNMWAVRCTSPPPLIQIMSPLICRHNRRDRSCIS